uniref:Uncharacterized protein n=1 Tax=Schistocephalus solidus TaxID=70667 RepID=A0A0X3Q3V8_SCHSO
MVDTLDQHEVKSGSGRRFLGCASECRTWGDVVAHVSHLPPIPPSVFLTMRAQTGEGRESAIDVAQVKANPRAIPCSCTTMLWALSDNDGQSFVYIDQKKEVTMTMAYRC